MSQRPFLACFALVAAFAALCASSPAQDKKEQGALTKKDTRVEPTHWGNVYGRVYDAGTGSPIKDAIISLETEEGFLDKGRSVGKTDELGGYRAQTILGRISHNFDLGRALLTSGIGMLFGAANNTTKRIDASRVSIRIQAPGYKSFDGVLVARTSNAGAFRIDMEPVLLVPEGREGESVAATGWAAVRIVAASAEPQVAKKGDVVKVYAAVRAFGSNPAKNIELAATCRLWRGERKLKVSKEQPSSDSIRFETEYKVSGKEKNGAEVVIVYIKRSVLDYNPRRWSTGALIQTATKPEQETAAQERATGLNLLRQGKYAEATSTFRNLAGSPGSAPCDLQFLAISADRCADYDAAVEAWQQMALNKEIDLGTGVSERARALYLGKKYEDSAKVVEEALKNVKPKEWVKKIDARAVGYLGLSYVKLKRLDGAQQLNESLLVWPSSGLDPTVIEFRNALRLAEVESVHAANPKSAPALADYGRALLDLGRYEEAVGKLKESLDLDATQTSLRRDIAWAALQMRGEPPSAGDLATAVAEAKAALNLDKSKLKSKDFFSWNKYAVLLFALAEQQKAAGSPDSIATSDEAISAFREALTLGRVGAKTNAGTFSYMYGYTSGSEVAITGFAYPQANASYVLLDSLKKLRKDPNNYLALFNQAASLLDLGQTSLAEQSVSRLLALKPEYSEAVFLSGLIQARLGDHAKGSEAFLRVLQLNPVHPRANLLLAELLARDGDVAASAERMAAHAKFYGETLAGQ